VTPLIHVPSKATLKKYGLDAESWLAILASQGWVCAICKKVPKTGRFNIDHDHARRWKQRPPEERRRHIRGIVCWWCNKTHLGRAITIEKAINVVHYLQAFAARSGQ
jgi:hypothetical protein